MQINISKLFFLSLICFPFLSNPQNQGLKTIIQEDLKRHLTFISSDSLQGRSFGTKNPGLEITAEYLKNSIKKIGLKSGADDYFQAVDIVSVKPDYSNTVFKIFNQEQEQTFISNSVICLDNNNNAFRIEGDVVITGYGIKDKKTGYNDFEGLNLEGKIVMFSEGNMQRFKNLELQTPNNRKESEKISNAYNAGAKAVILVSGSKNKKKSGFNKTRSLIKESNYILKSDKEIDETGNFFMVTPEVADELLGGKRKFRKYLSSISRKGKPNSFEIENQKIEIDIQKEITPVYSNNVIGFIKGSDPELKDEYLVFMAHYDHLGISSNGDVYNGADDNGSGTVVLLELAEAFNSLQIKPKRSIVFLWVTGEEIGMYGSDWYTQNPVFPLDKTVACINLDMVGRVYELRDSVWKDSPKIVKDFDGLFTVTNDVWPELKQISNSVCKELNLKPDSSLPAYFLRSSDHYHFHKNKIAVLNVATGYHADYHKPTDEVSRINFDKMKRVADYCFLVGFELANKEK